MSGQRVSNGWGLVLSGGAACGLANIGVLEVLEREGYRPSCIAGSSMGAIVAALYALGHSPATMHEMTAGLAPASVVRLSARPFRAGLHGGALEQQLEQHLEPLIGDARIGDCAMPFVCVAGRVRAPIRWERLLLPGFVDHLRECVEAYVFPDDVLVLDAIRASSAIPVVFSPVEVNGEEFVDLVHFGPIPARALRRVQSPQVVIATDTQPSYESLEPLMPRPLREFLVAGREETLQSIAVCDLVIRPELPASPLRFDCGDAFIDAGERAARTALDDVRSLIDRR